MERLTFEVENTVLAQMLISFARTLGSSLVAEERRNAKSVTTTTDQEIIRRGCDIAAFGNPVEWQREVRCDRPLPIIEG